MLCLMCKEGVFLSLVYLKVNIKIYNTNLGAKFK